MKKQLELSPDGNEVVRTEGDINEYNFYTVDNTGENPNVSAYIRKLKLKYSRRWIFWGQFVTTYSRPYYSTLMSEREICKYLISNKLAQNKQDISKKYDSLEKQVTAVLAYRMRVNRDVLGKEGYILKYKKISDFYLQNPEILEAHSKGIFVDWGAENIHTKINVISEPKTIERILQAALGETEAIPSKNTLTVIISACKIYKRATWRKNLLTTLFMFLLYTKEQKRNYIKRVLVKEGISIDNFLSTDKRVYEMNTEEVDRIFNELLTKKTV